MESAERWDIDRSASRWKTWGTLCRFHTDYQTAFFTLIYRWARSLEGSLGLLDGDYVGRKLGNDTFQDRGVDTGHIAGSLDGVVGDHVAVSQVSTLASRVTIVGTYTL